MAQMGMNVYRRTGNLIDILVLGNVRLDIRLVLCLRRRRGLLLLKFVVRGK